jgi:acyl-CoA thioester hydrolase
MDRVYYANYLEICERARTEFLRDVGYPYKEIEASGLFFPVRSCQVRYFGYAEYDDELTCRSHVSRLRHATLTITTDIFEAGGEEEKPLVTGVVELACIGKGGKPCVIPDGLRTVLEPYVAE